MNHLFKLQICVVIMMPLLAFSQDTTKAARSTDRLLNQQLFTVPKSPNNTNISLVLERVDYCRKFLLGHDSMAFKRLPVMGNGKSLVFVGEFSFTDNRCSECALIFICPVDINQEYLRCKSAFAIQIKNEAIIEYTEHGSTEQLQMEKFSKISFYENGTPNKMICSVDDLVADRELLWDANGVTQNVDEIRFGQTFHNINIQKSTASDVPFRFREVNIPTNCVKEKRLLSFFDELRLLLTNDVPVLDFFYRLAKHPILSTGKNDNSCVMILSENDIIKEIVASVPNPKSESLLGYNIKMAENGSIVSYMIGDIENFSNPFCSSDTVVIGGSGIEVKFHPTGYPASYKTIVKNRLFGRQIEWNDKGEVISDVDLDIPKPWADAPKPVPQKTDSSP